MTGAIPLDAVQFDAAVEALVVSLVGDAISVSGPVNAGTIGLLLGAVDFLHSRGAAIVTVDLRDAGALDGAAALELHGARADAARAGWDLSLRNLSRSDSMARTSASA